MSLETWVAFVAASTILLVIQRPKLARVTFIALSSKLAPNLLIALRRAN